MAKPEWGVKRVCQSCAIKFYDLNRTPINCPKCGATFDPEALLKSRRSRPPAPAKVAKPKPAEAIEGETKEVIEDEADLVEDEDAIAALSDDDEDDDSVIEDASELGDDDVSDVVITGDDEED